MALILRNGCLITFDPSAPVFEAGEVRVEGDRIARAGPAGSAGAADGDAVLDAGGRYVLPGLVCAHHHFYSALALGFSPGGAPPRDFTGILETLWWPLDRALTLDDIAVSAEATLLACIERGVTTVLDHHESQGAQPGALVTLAAAVRRAGIRASLSLGASDRDGRGREGIEATRAFLAGLDPRDRFVRGMVGLHASFTAGDALLADAAALAAGAKAGVHVHLAEDGADDRISEERTGKRALDRLDGAGLVGPKTVLVHGVRLSEADLDRVADRGAVLVHNPESNQNNAVGLAPVPAALERGIPVGLGTDGMSSDVIAQGRAAFLLRRHASGDPRAGFAESWRMLSEGNPEIASRAFEIPLGRIRAGAGADLAVLDAFPPTPVTPDNAAGHVLFALAGVAARTVVCGGRVIRRDGVTLTLDAAKVAGRARRHAAALWERLCGSSS